MAESTAVFVRSNGIAWIGSRPPLPILKKRTAPLGPFCCGWPKGARDRTHASNCRTVTTAIGQERTVGLTDWWGGDVVLAITPKECGLA